ncbi:MAG TPA: 1-(5-phosphoribosyl)-5-amino-4-imidazole-carboxylate carboxylase, partial [Firmicutes bacterium]|nr:1-(5-phosphoribosyl)-5-amino-4-imidazole-carboxylate carboxylase [Bacillota bacterium]
MENSKSRLNITGMWCKDMKENYLVELLEAYKKGEKTLPQAMEALKKFPFEDLDFARIDHHRALRRGFPEVIFCQGKSEEQVTKIFKSLVEKNSIVLATRAWPSLHAAVLTCCPEAKYHDAARIISYGTPGESERKGKILVVSAGTADMPVAEEAFISASYMGHRVEKVYDVGVAGI